MLKGLKVRISEYRFYEDLDDFSFLFELYGAGVAFRQRFYWFDDNIFITIRPPYSVPSRFGCLYIDDYATMASIAQQLDIYRKRFEHDLFNVCKRKYDIV